mmetsp:Transcript_96828/g.289191  ORF Transcript_96828/g.289191 Transcript_96828/m.289191 type:complete len:345 (+) Transcript_96828:398-1432(+)
MGPTRPWRGPRRHEARPRDDRERQPQRPQAGRLGRLLAHFFLRSVGGVPPGPQAHRAPQESGHGRQVHRRPPRLHDQHRRACRCGRPPTKGQVRRSRLHRVHRRRRDLALHPREGRRQARRLVRAHQRRRPALRPRPPHGLPGPHRVPPDEVSRVDLCEAGVQVIRPTWRGQPDVARHVAGWHGRELGPRVDRGLEAYGGVRLQGLPDVLRLACWQRHRHQQAWYRAGARLHRPDRGAGRGRLRQGPAAAEESLGLRRVARRLERPERPLEDMPRDQGGARLRARQGRHLLDRSPGLLPELLLGDGLLQGHGQEPREGAAEAAPPQDGRGRQRQSGRRGRQVRG